jgi:hypothetical protein
MARPHKQIGPTVPQNVGGAVPSKPEDGGRRKGRAMKRHNPATTRLPYVTKQQLLAARELGGSVTVSKTGRPLMVTYYRKAE